MADLIQLDEWNQAKIILAEAKRYEAELRAAVEADFFKTHKNEGVERIDIGGGYDLKGSFDQTYKVENDDVAGCAEALANEGFGEYVDELFKQSFTISKSKYKALPAPAQKLVDLILTIKPASTKLEIVQTKG